MFPLFAGSVAAHVIVLIVTAVLLTTYFGWRERQEGFTLRETLLIHGYLTAMALLGAVTYAFVERTIRFGPDGHFFFSGLRHPGAVLGVLAGLPVLRRLLPHHISTPRFLDLLAPAVAFGMAGVRVGCMVRGCCFGDVSSQPWAFRFPMASPATLYQVATGVLPSGSYASLPAHPLQVYFALHAITVGCLLIWLRRRQTHAGQVALLFLGLFEGGKGALEFLRPPLTGGRHLAVVSLSVAAGALGVLLLQALRIKRAEE